MRNFKCYLTGIAVLALLFSSCSKEEVSSGQNQSSDEVAVLTFAPTLIDMLNKAALKQEASGLPECSDTEPAYASISLTYGSGEAQTDVDVTVEISKDDNGYFTLYDDMLEIPIPSGETTVPVTLNDFWVYNDTPDAMNPEAPGTLIWMAPKSGSEYASFVDNPLPLSWDLRAGSKTYTDVEVLCFDNREVNLYGYQFFDITPIPLIKFCLFGNFCTESGRHYPASYSVDVWEWADGQQGDQLYNDVTSEVMMDNGEYYADPLCFFLPDREGQDEYYFEITLLDVEGQYDGPDRVILSGVITDDEIKNFYNGDNLDYYHFQFGCDDGTPPPFSDPEDTAKHYKACIKSLDNDSYAIGFAYLSLKGTALEAIVLAANVEPNKAHPQHVHENASCGDYGGVFWPLELEGGGFPTADDMGFITYKRDFVLTSTEAANANFADRTVVLHGKMVDGSYMAGEPIACGEFSTY